MINIGEFNDLSLSRFVDFGCYLTDDDGDEVLLPKRYLNGGETVGDCLRVFVYNDSENRLLPPPRNPRPLWVTLP